MEFYPLVPIWAACQLMQIVLGLWAVWPGRSTTATTKVLMGVSLALGMSSCFTLITFIRVFVIGSGSNVAQLAGESGFDLWRAWLHVWEVAIVLNPTAFVLLVIAVLLPPYPPKDWPSFLSRFGGLVAAGCASVICLRLFPDA